MAESIVSDIAVELISKLGSFALKEIGVCWGLRDELDKLKRTVATIEAVLLHAEEQSIHNPQLKSWLGMLSDALYDADDLLDEFSTEALRQQLMGGSTVAKKVRLFFSSPNLLAFGINMGHKVRELRERLDEIAAEKSKFHLEERSVVERRFVSNGRDQTHSSPPEVVIGREKEKEALVELLRSPDYKENVSVIPIVGIGGLGKTTLAQMVYNDDRVKNHFELKMWVYVSDNFDVQLLVKNVLESASGQATQNTQMDLLKNRLHEKINGRKYLLVLDDVWNEDINKWSSFKDLLVGGSRGSKIVITTRLRTVADMSRPIYVHELRGLEENESWSLFQQVAFKQEQLLNQSLEAIGKGIVEKCCGVPLAIKTIGGVLYFKDHSEWLMFKDNELSKIDAFKHDILPILRLSYNHLPSHYKHCFAYCSLYPKHFTIHVDALIQQWKAQGYLKSTNLNESLREAGFEYFMDLFRLSFFQDVEKDDFGNIEYCKLHDLMHDLAVSVAGDNFSASHSEKRSITNNSLHVSFFGRANYLSRYVSSLLEAKKIRTILTIDMDFGSVTKQDIDVMFCNLRCLRVLDLSHMGIAALPNSIYKLKHLRHLDLSLSSIKKLPDSITRLYNLQVLKLENCTNLLQFPSSITKLVNLTDLDSRGCRKLNHMPRGVGKLTRLEKLSEFVIAKNRSVSKHIGGLDELNSLNNLSGEMNIKNLRYVKNAASEFAEARLSLKQKLQKLAIYWVDHEDEDENDEDENSKCGENDVANEEMGMEALRPHPNLKELMVSRYRGVKHPSWLLSITNLVSVRFESCENIQWLPPFDQLPHLKVLWVWGLTKLERIDVENGGGSSPFFPSLTHLTLAACPNLKGFERRSLKELQCFPCLSLLRIRGCPNLTCLPDFSKISVLYSDGDRIKWVMGILKRPASQSTSSAFSTLSQLQRLEISNMEDFMEDELLKYLPSLLSLTFLHCSFKTVCNDDKDDGMQWRSLRVLRSVEFHSLQNLVALPKGLQYVTTLQHLNIAYCHRLACIPEWMPKLLALQDLTISMCGLLEERCKKSTTQDWPYISHIPNISIDWKPIQKNGSYLL